MELSTKHYIDLMEEVKPALYESYSLFNIAKSKMIEVENLKKSRTNGKLSFGQFLIAIIGYCCGMIPGIIYFFYAKSNNKSKDVETDKKILELNEEIDNIAVKFNSLKLEILTGVHSSNPMLLIQQIVPEDYLYPPSDAFDCILSYFKYKRADNIKEAMNLYEEEKYKERIENVQLANLYQSRLQTAGTYANVIANSMNKNN